MVPVGTKVSPEAYARLQSICASKGLKLYEMLQMLLDCIIRFMDDQHNLSYELESVIAMFDNFHNWGTEIRVTDELSKMKVEQAFYVLIEPKSKGGEIVVRDENGDAKRDDLGRPITIKVPPTKPHTGHRIVWVQGKCDDMWRRVETYSSFNKIEALEAFICCLDPSLYKELRQIAEGFDYDKIYPLLKRVHDDYTKGKSVAELREEFENNDWVNNAKQQSPAFRAKSTRDTQTKMFES